MSLVNELMEDPENDSSRSDNRLLGVKAKFPNRGARSVMFARVEEIQHELEVHQIELEIQNQELKDSRAHLEAALERYQSLYDIAPVGYVTIDRTGAIREINLTAASLLGTDRSALVNRKLISWVAEADRPRFRAHIARQEGVGESFSINLSLVSGSSRKIPVQMQSTLVNDEISGQIWMRAVLTDLSEVHRLVEHLESERTLREQFVSGLSHDLRTPLTAARLSAQLLAKEIDPASLQGRQARRVVQGIDRTEQMISDLLDANRIQAEQGVSLKIEACDLVAMVKSTLSELNVFLGDRIRLSCSQSIEGFWDCRALRRVLENLVNNAEKYGCKDEPILVILAELAGRVEISVHNRGNPISTDDQKTLFCQFRRSSNAIQSGQRGWGIGLALVRGIAEAHGGSVKVSSSREAGTLFSVSIPMDARGQLG